MGALSNIQTSPVFNDTVISTGKKFKYRPYTAGEEQALLTAKESEDAQIILDTAKKVIQDCTFDSLNVENLAGFDIEYILLMLRAKSVGEEIDLSLNCKHDECKGTKDLVLNIEKDLAKPELKKDANKVQINENVTLVMKYPGFNVLDILAQGESSMFKIVAGLIDTVVDGETVINTVDLDPKEVVQFVENMNSKTLKKIVDDFILKLPKLEHKLTFKCDTCGKENKYEFEGLKNFFI